MEERFSAFTYLISSLSRHIRRIKTKEVFEYDLKSSHVLCLYYINRAGEITAKDLSESCGEDKGAISRSLEDLEKKGLIKTVVVEGKKYKTPITLTENGKTIAKAIDLKISTTLEKAGEGLSDEDRGIMYRSLEIINNNLKGICVQYED